ncbi:MAG: creatininase family protein [Oscillospiraceae bacterium]|nr:creatininase family protein [Oscillospiraceae bacterium]
MTSKVLYQEMLPHELAERVTDCPIAYLPLGTLEWHGFHLPYGVDMLLPLEVFKRLAARVGGVVLPPLFLGPDLEQVRGKEVFYGMDILSFEEGHPQHLTGNAYHIPKELYIQILDNICKNLKRNGFAALIGHGHGPSSNTFLECKERFAREYGLFIANLYEIGKEMLVDHAAVNETSLMMALYGGLADLSRMPEGAPSPAVWGPDPRGAASAEEGRRVVEQNEDIVCKVLSDLKETLPKPRLELNFHHVKDLTAE